MHAGRIILLIVSVLLAGCDAPSPLRGECNGEDLNTGLLYADCSHGGPGIALRTDQPESGLLDRVTVYPVRGDFDGPVRGVRPDYLL